MDDLLNEFLTETNESLDTVDRQLIEFERNPSNKDIVNNMFRLVHTIKGTCGFLGLPRLEAVAHASENLLGKFRDDELEPTPAVVSLILEALDSIKELLAFLEEQSVEPKGDDAELIARLDAATEGRLEELAPAKPEAAKPANDSGPAPAAAEEIAAPTAAEPVVSAKDDAQPEAAQPQSGESRSVTQSIRVNVDVLENLMTMVSELVLVRNQLLQMVRNMDDSEFRKPLERLSAITGELQDGVMKTRMQPIGNAWQKLPRIVRDASQELGKKINLVMRGEETELDRQVLDLIKDPLTHMVRNSVDHGLEGPDERVASGKSETGTITLRAFHEGGHIIIELSDNGRGLRTDKIKKRAIERGVVTQADADAMADAQIHKFIFAPGFSTAEKITSISGRGVGMDVVRTNIELIGGSIDLRSVEREGTVFTIKIPLTLAIVSALIVKAKGERFAIPQLSVVELVRTGSTDGDGARVENINESHVLRLRDRLLPLVDVQHLLWGGAERMEEGQSSFVVVMQVGGQKFGLIVDEVFDTEEIVVKPVASVIRDIRAYSGNTILGDGSVIMILDPNGIASAITTNEDDLVAAQSEEDEQSRYEETDTTALLVFRAGSKEPKAVPLSLVTRLEEVDISKIEQSLGASVVQYRDKLMPVLYAGQNLGGMKTEGEQPLLVFTDEGKAMGLAVDEIVDIVDAELDIELASAQPGILGSAIINEQATEILDVSFFLKKAFRDWFRRGHVAKEGEAARRLLLVDDNAFFRNMVTPMLKVAGYHVTSVASVDDAWRLHAGGDDFDVIVSDIEMPGTNGFDFARAVRKDKRWGATPLIAVSANEAPDYVARGQAAGFADYVAKSDGDRLITSLTSAVQASGEAA